MTLATAANQSRVWLAGRMLCRMLVIGSMRRMLHQLVLAPALQSSNSLLADLSKARRMEKRPR